MIRLFLLLTCAYGVLGNCPGNSLINQTSAPIAIADGYSSRITVLKSGRVLTVFKDNSDSKFYGQLMESDGTLVGGKISLTLAAAGKRRLLSHGNDDFDVAPFKNGFLTVRKHVNQFLVGEYDNNGALVNTITHLEHDGKDNLENVHLVVFSDDSFSVAYAAPMTIKTSHHDNPGTQNLPNERVQWFNSDLTTRGSPTVSPRYDTPWSVIDPTWNTGWMEHHERIIGAVALEGDRLMTFVWNQHYSGHHPVKNRIHCHIYEKNGTIAKWLVLNQPTDDDSLRYWHVKAHPGGFRAQRKNEVNVFKVHSNLTFSKTANILPDGLKYFSKMDPAPIGGPSQMVDYAASTSTLEINDLDVKPIVDGTIVATYKLHDDDQFYIALYNDGNLASGPYTIGDDSGDYEVHQGKVVIGDNLMVLYEYDEEEIRAGMYKLNLCNQPPQGGQPTPTATPDGDSTHTGLAVAMMVLVVVVVVLGLRASFVIGHMDVNTRSKRSKSSKKMKSRKPRSDYTVSDPR